MIISKTEFLEKVYEYLGDNNAIDSVILAAEYFDVNLENVNVLLNDLIRNKLKTEYEKLNFFKEKRTTRSLFSYNS